MALGEIPPWLDVKPSDFVRAGQMGAESGIAAQRTYASQVEAQDRLGLAYATLASQERRADEAAQAKLQAAMMGMQLRQQQQEAALELRAQQNAALNAYREARLGQFETAEQQREQAAAALREYRDQRLGQFERGMDVRESLGERGLDIRQQLGEELGSARERGLDLRQRALDELGAYRDERLRLQDQREQDLSAYRDALLGLKEAGLAKGGSKSRISLPKSNFGPAISGPADSPEIVARLEAEKQAEAAKASRPGLFRRIFGVGQSPAAATLKPSDEEGELELFPGEFEPQPLPASKDDLVIGEIYDTKRGPARWTGENFEKL